MAKNCVLIAVGAKPKISSLTARENDCLQAGCSTQKEGNYYHNKIRNVDSDSRGGWDNARKSAVFESAKE